MSSGSISMTPLRTALRKETSDTIEYGEAILVALRLKMQRQLDLIAAAQNEDAVALWRSMLDILAVQDKLSRERHRLSTLQL
jgi:hypothetical protein